MTEFNFNKPVIIDEIPPLVSPEIAQAVEHYDPEEELPPPPPTCENCKSFDKRNMTRFGGRIGICRVLILKVAATTHATDCVDFKLKDK